MSREIASLPPPQTSVQADAGFGGTPAACAVSHDVRPGVVAAILILFVYAGIALSIDFPRAAIGVQSDEATYYMMGHSLAQDGDLAYRREDLVRVWREFPSGPSGIFLKRGRDVDLTVGGAAPFIHVQSRPDPDRARLFYGKSFLYPLVAAPLVALAGTSGFLLLHAVLLALATLAAYLFLNTRMKPSVALLLSTAFIMASVAPVYFVWITPELFNFATVLMGGLCWLYKEVSPGESVARGLRWLERPSSDYVAAILLAAATCSKPSNALMVVPLLVWLITRRRARAALLVGMLFAALVAVFFAANVAISGEWNFQGGDRRTFYAAYPFLTPVAGMDVGLGRTTNVPLWDVIFGPDFWTVLLHNLGYFFVGRYSGLVAYFFPAVFALAVFAAAPTRRPLWQWLVLATAVAQILLFIITIPYNYFGGGGVVGNRYFMNAYGLFIFLLPPIGSVAIAMIPWIVGSLFVAQLTFNPFFSSFYPAEAAKAGPLRLLPVELTLVNDLPINTSIARVRRPFGNRPRFQIYFLDDNAFEPEGNTFWVRGQARAELLVKSAEPASRFAATLASGDATTQVTITIGGATRRVEMAPGEIRQIMIPLKEGFPYQGTRVWKAAITSSGGFVPMFSAGGTDSRYLGVRVKPELFP